MKKTQSQIEFKKALWSAMCSTSNKERAMRIIHDMYKAAPAGNLDTKAAAVKFLKTANPTWDCVEGTDEYRFAKWV